MRDIRQSKQLLETSVDRFFRFRNRRRIFFPQLLAFSQKAGKILEVGVGKGRMVKILKANNIEADFYGIDINDNVMRSDTIPTIGDARKLPFPDGMFDLVYSLGVVEHFPETEEAIKEHARVTKRGGYVLVTTPHLSIFTPLRYLVYLLRDRSKGSFEEISGKNIRLTTMKNFFKCKFENRGFGFYGVYGIGRVLRKYNSQAKPPATPGYAGENRKNCAVVFEKEKLLSYNGTAVPVVIARKEQTGEGEFSTHCPRM